MGNCCATTSEEVETQVVTSFGGSDQFRGKVAFVTGPTTGIGKHTSLVLARLGFRVILAGRGRDRLAALEDYIKAQVPDASLVSLELDLSDLDSVRNCAQQFIQLDTPLHLLINNAGVMGGPYRTSKQGFEMQMATNHLGHFLLTELLLPSLKRAPSARIICVSSLAHQMAKLDPHNPLMNQDNYSEWPAYGNSKLANALHARALNHRLQGTRVTAYSLHPGSIASDLGRNNCWAACYYTTFRCFQKNLTQGAATSLYCALSPEVEANAGEYFKDCHLAEPTRAAKDLEGANALYQVSLNLVGLQNSNAHP